MNSRNIGGGILAVTRVFRDAVASPLRRYVIYSLLVHAALVGLFSMGMLLPEKEGDAASVAAGSEKTDASTEQEGAVAPDKAGTPSEDSYYQNAGVDTTPADDDEMPDSPFGGEEGTDLDVDLKLE